MITQETVNSARTWYDTGVRRIANDTINLGMSYLDKAIPVFEEVGDLRMLTYARHHKLLGYKLDERDEEVENQFPLVMEGYVRLEDSYGKALLLTHLAESLAHEGRTGPALAHFNLALVLAENDDLTPLATYVLEQQAALYARRENQVQAARLLEHAEELAEAADASYAFARYRFQRAQVLVQLGETGEAHALLEDVQSRYVNEHRFPDAIEPLSLLRRLYEDAGMADDRNRVTRLLHLCGQQMIRTDEVRRRSIYQGPPIDRAA